MARIQIPVALLEFDEGGHTLWVHSPEGATVLRIKIEGEFRVRRECENVVSHADIYVTRGGEDGDVYFCVKED